MQAIVKIQSCVRGWFARDFYQTLKAEKLAREVGAEEAMRRIKLTQQEREQQLQAERKESEQRKVEQRSIEEYAAGIDNMQKKLQKMALKTQEQRKAPSATSSFSQSTSSLRNATSFGTLSRTMSKNSMFQIPDSNNVDDIFGFLEKLDQNNSSSSKSTTRLDSSSTIEFATMISSEFDTQFKAEKKRFLDGSRQKVALAGHRLKLNPLANKRNQAATDGEGNFKTSDWPLRLYAVKHFSTKKGNKNANSDTDIDELLCHTVNLIQIPMLDANIPTFSTSAVLCFNLLSKVLEPAKKMEDMFKAMKEIIEVGISIPSMRDEIFIHIIRQITSPPSLASIKNWNFTCSQGWLMMSLACSFFSPSKLFSKYLLAYFIENTERGGNTSDIALSAKYCEQIQRQISLNGPRKAEPSMIEINAIRFRNQLPIKITLMNGIVKTIMINSGTSCSDAVKEVAKLIGLKDFQGWAIFEVSDMLETGLRGSDYVMDLFSKWENDVLKSLKSGSLKAKSAADIMLVDSSGQKSKLVMRKKIFRNFEQIPSDPVEFELIYAQATFWFLHDYFPMKEKSALQYAALKAQVEHGNYDEKQSSR